MNLDHELKREPNHSGWSLSVNLGFRNEEAAAEFEAFWDARGRELFVMWVNEDIS
jgi:hypothetical protein